MDAEQIRTAYGAWLGGLLGGMADPKTYPKFEDVIGGGESESESGQADEADDTGDANGNAGAKLWIMFLNS